MSSDSKGYSGLEIAVVGMAGRFAKARNLGVLWENLRHGLESVSFFSDEELDERPSPELAANPDFVRARAMLEDAALFDAQFFGYSPREAQIIDPQQRVFLEVAWEALEDAGYDAARLPGPVGVFAGVGVNTYYFQCLARNPDLLRTLGEVQLGIANDKDYLANRISYKLNLEGPAIVVQTACSTSLVAIHLACQSLLAGECDLALAGGVSISFPQRRGYLFHPNGINSPDGHCRAFDAKAQGTVSGEGAALVVLRRLEDALQERDSIRAIIKGSAVNNDGALKAGFTAPRIEGQANVIRAAHQVSEVDPSTIQYIEAHGSGTELGDPIEIAALTDAFRAGGAAGRGYCAVGSVKTNIGHTDSAAGAAGVIKTVLALQHRQIPASLHFEQPNPHLELDESPFFICNQLRDWNSDGTTPRRAGVSSFGLGGTNAHVVLEEAPPRPQPAPSRPWQLLPFSARSRSALDDATLQLSLHLHNYPELPLADVAYTLQTGRQAFLHRCAMVCRSSEEMDQILCEENSPRLLYRRCADSARAPLVFLFPGLGEQYAGMGRELYQQEEVFRRELDRCAEMLQPLLGLDIRQALFPPQQESGDEAEPGVDLRRMVRGQAAKGASGQLDETWLVQPALLAVEYALARQWMSWGLVPDAMLGYSLGEYVAACLAGVFSLQDALTLTARRALLIEQLPEGAMLAVPLPEEKLKELLSGDLSISAINGPSLCVAAGPPPAVSDLEKSLQERGLACRRLQTSHAFHSRMMHPAREAMGRLMASVQLNPPQIPYLSNLTGKWIEASEATDPDYWVQHLCQPVRFAQAVTELWQMEGRLMLEVGPGQSLTSLVLQHPESAQDSERVVLPSMRHQYDRQSDQAFLLTSLGQLWMAGAQVDWGAFWGREERYRVPLPTYPFERKLFWVEPKKEGPAPDRSLAETPDPDERLPRISDWFHAPIWKRSVQPAVCSRPAKDEQRLWLIFQRQSDLRDELVRRLKKRGQRVEVAELSPNGEEFQQSGGRFLLDPSRPEHFDALLDGLGGVPDRILHLWTLGGEGFALDADTLSRRQAEGFTSLLLLVQALGKRPLPDSMQLTLVTNGLAELEREDELDPAKALMLGPMRVIPYEYPQIRCCTIDVASDGADRLASNILAEVEGSGDDELVAWRGDWRWLPDYQAVPLPETSDTEIFRQQGCYLITGGLGGIGLALAEHLARKVKARLVLTGRSGLPQRSQWPQILESGGKQSRVIEKVQAIEALGSEVLIGQADVSDETAMDRLLDDAGKRFGGLDGVIHAAGVPGQGLIQLKTREQASSVLAPKVEGTRALARLLQKRKPGLLALFSSMTALSGGIGEVDYTAANAFLDAFAHWHSRQTGIPTISINWCAWQWDAWMDQGMAGFRPEVREYLEQQRAAYGLSFDEGAQALERALSSGLSQLVVSTRRLQGRLERRQTVADVLEQMEAVRRSEGMHARPDLATEYLAPRNEGESRIAAIWQELLGIDRAGVHDDFFQLGGHSLLGTRLMARIYESFGVSLPLRALFETPTVAGLSQAVEQSSNGQGQEPSQKASIPRRQRGTARQLLEELDQMSDQEVDALLARKVARKEKRP